MQGNVNPTGYLEAPAPQWPGLVCLWSSGLRPDAGAPFVQLVVPDGCVDLVWRSRTARVEVAGPDTGPAPALIEPGESLVGARFGPGMAPPALGVPADAVRDGRVPLRELWGAGADRLGEAMAASADPAAVLAEAVARVAGAPDPLVPAMVAGLAGSPVREAARELGLSERQLRRRALASFGYGPKTLQRILRFQRALGMARAGRPLADVAFAAGYADQPHLAHEVRDLAGEPISALL